MFRWFIAYFSQEILKDFSESDFHSIKTEFQQVLTEKKWLSFWKSGWNAHFDIEKFKNVIQKENDSICQVSNKIIAIMNELTLKKEMLP